MRSRLILLSRFLALLLLMRFVNRSGYDTDDLRAFIEKAFKAYGVRSRDVEVIVVAAPKRSRGCAEVGRCTGKTCVGGRRMVLAIAPPSYDSSYDAFLRRFSNLIRHESAHLLGYEHEDMNYHLLYSYGPIPPWAREWTSENGRIRYRGRAPNQMETLG